MLCTGLNFELHVSLLHSKNFGRHLDHLQRLLPIFDGVAIALRYEHQVTDHGNLDCT